MEKKPRSNLEAIFIPPTGVLQEGPHIRAEGRTATAPTKEQDHPKAKGE